MLGDMVDQDFEVKSGDPVQFGQIIGWMEGFKAISDLYALVDGTFDQVNPSLQTDLTAITKDPYATGWLYQARGKVDPRCMPVSEYTDLLDATIDKILEQQKQEAEES
jgi:glycine cleavage system H protein